MNKQKVIFIGPAGGGKVPQNGASAKNYHLTNYFHKKKINVVSADTENWRKNPLVLVKLVFFILFNPNAKYIIATNNMSSYRVLQIMSLFPRKRSIVYWIIGGSIAEWIKEGKVNAKPFRIVDVFLAEGKKMQETLSGVGFKNTIYVPNFKCIDYLPEKKAKTDDKMHFVFLSRIIPEKGCNTIIEAVKKLNKKYTDNFTVDFYGQFEAEYESQFKDKISIINNISYKGFLDLRNQRNYDILAKYDAMLFPTYWHGEGFPGIIIDAFVSGLPVIATDWSLNADIIEDGKTGVILKENTIEALADAMDTMINNPKSVELMSKTCQNSAMNFDIKNVVSDKLLEKIGIC